MEWNAITEENKPRLYLALCVSFNYESEPVLVTHKDWSSSQKHCRFARLFAKDKNAPLSEMWWATDRHGEKLDPTHWMPQPEPLVPGVKPTLY